MESIVEAFGRIWEEFFFTPGGSALSTVVAVLSVVGMWMLFKKANKAGWRSLVPILNLYTLVQIADGSGIKCILLLIPVIGVIYHILLNLRLARAFGKGLFFGLGLILFTPLFLLFLGFGGAEYRGAR